MVMMPITIGRYTDPGPRLINEDAIFVLTFPFDHVSEVIAILGVADGMGGLKKGQEASYSVLDILQSNLTDRIYSIKEKLPREKVIEFMEKEIEKIFDLANREILKMFKEGNSDRASAGCTLTIAVVLKGDLIIGHVGDSKAYLIRKDRRIVQLTEDQSIGKKLLNRLGMENMIVQKITSKIEEGEVILLCTDGVTDCLSTEELKNIILTTSTIQSACNKIIFKAKEYGTTDNCSVVALEYGKIVRKPFALDDLEMDKTKIKDYTPYQDERATSSFWRKVAYIILGFLCLLFVFFLTLSIHYSTIGKQRSNLPQPNEISHDLSTSSISTQPHGVDTGGKRNSGVQASNIDNKKINTISYFNKENFWIKVSDNELNEIDISKKDFMIIEVPYLPENLNFELVFDNGKKVERLDYEDISKSAKDSKNKHLLKISLKGLEDYIGGTEKQRFKIKETSTLKDTQWLTLYNSAIKIKSELEEFKNSVKIELKEDGYLRDQDNMKLNLSSKWEKKIESIEYRVEDQNGKVVIDPKHFGKSYDKVIPIEKEKLEIGKEYNLKLSFKISDFPQPVDFSFKFTYLGSIKLKGPTFNEKSITFEAYYYPSMVVEDYYLKIAPSKELLDKENAEDLLKRPFPSNKSRVDIMISEILEKCGEKEKYFCRVSAKIKGKQVWVFSENKEIVLKGGK
jgi:protein phosphatase